MSILVVIDETGFSGDGSPNIVGGLVLAGKPGERGEDLIQRAEDAAERYFAATGRRGKRFHATEDVDSLPTTRERLRAFFLDPETARDGLRPAVARFEIPQRPQDLHAWSLVSSVGAWIESLQFDQRFANAAAGGNVFALIERKGPFDMGQLEASLQRELRRRGSHRLGATAYLLPKRVSHALGLVDLLAYLARYRQLDGVPKMPYLVDVTIGSGVDWEEALDTARTIACSSRATPEAVSEPGAEPPGLQQAGEDAGPVARLSPNLLTDVLESAAALLAGGRERQACRDVFAPLWSAALDFSPEMVRSTIPVALRRARFLDLRHVDRDSQRLGQSLVDLLREWLESAHAPWRDEALVETAARWLDISNHLGHDASDAPELEAIRPVIRKLAQDPDRLHLAVDIENLRTVSLHNSWRFREALDGCDALRRLWLGERLPSAKALKRDFTGARRFSVAAFLGTTANNHFFMAGVERDDGAATFHHEQGMDLSTLAEGLFDDPSDAVRHPVYRAHALAQRAMRHGSDDDLAKARALLAGVERLRSGDGVVADHYLQRLREGDPLDNNEVYRLSLWLKLDWISDEAPDRDDIGTLESLAARHPWEQIVGYLAMGRGPLAERAREVLMNLDWPRFSVAVITEVFRAQVEFETFGKLSSVTIDRVRASAPPRVLAFWRSEGLDRELDALNSPDEDAAGPLVVLPYNYF